MAVRNAIGLPVVGEFGDPVALLDLAVAAEEAGWDGVYLWDHLLFHDPEWPVANPVVALSAIAARTRRVRLGILMTALPRRRVQVVAREAASLDVLSGGRLVFGAGLGSMDSEYTAFGENPDLRVRAEALDSGLSALARLWTGEPTALPSGETVTMRPAPVQRPRIPIWCPGRWPNRVGFRRAARWDGAMPTFVGYGAGRPVPPEDFARVVEFLAAQRGSLDGYDIAVEGESRDGSTVEPYAAAGLTWWIEAMGWWRGGVAEAARRIAAGPPR